jgi:hypothetical protein
LKKFASAFRGHLIFGKLPLEKRMGLTPTTFEWEGYYAMQIGIGIKYYLILGPLFWKLAPP